MSMNVIKSYVADNISCAEIICDYDEYFEFQTNLIKVAIYAPNVDLSKYIIDITTVKAFDRWHNSTAISKMFDTEQALCDYLKFKKCNIYKELLEYLSDEFV